MSSSRSQALRRLTLISNMSATVAQTVIYRKVGDVEIPLDVHVPDRSKNVPVVLWFHGGGLLQGRRDKIPPHFLNAMHTHSFALVSADYRLAPQVGVAEIFEDVRACVEFIRSPEGLSKHIGEDVIDTSRLAVSGGSAGGYLAFLTGLYIEPKPKVIMPIYPITDPLGTFFITPQPHPMGTVEHATVAEFMDPSKAVVANNDWASKRSSSYFWMMQEANLAQLLKVTNTRGPDQDRWRVPRQIRKYGLPPTYVVHGDADRFVGVEQCDEAAGVMLGEHVTFQYERLHDQDHLFDMKEEVIMKDMYDFMSKYL